jgi:hypothetical protein
MARLEFENGTEVGDAFKRVGRTNRVGRKHNHQPRGRAREKARRNLANGKAIRAAKFRKKLEKYHALVAAYWAGAIDSHPAAPFVGEDG